MSAGANKSDGHMCARGRRSVACVRQCGRPDEEVRACGQGREQVSCPKTQESFFTGPWDWGVIALRHGFGDAKQMYIDFG